MVAKNSIFITCIVLVGVFCLSCNNNAKPLSETVLPGIYEGHYADGVEFLELKDDKSFIQTFNKGDAVVYSNKGRWEIDSGSLYFIEFNFYIDKRAVTSDNEKIYKHYNRISASWDGNNQCILIDEERGYFLKRKAAQ